MDAPARTLSPGAALRRFFARDWERWLDEYPEVASRVGAAGRDDRWTDDSPAGIERRRAHLAESRATLLTLGPDGLSPSDRLQFDLYRDLLDTAVEGERLGFDPLPFRFGMPHHLAMPVDQMDAVHLSAGEVLELQPRGSVRALEAILARLAALPAALEQNRALLESGLARGFSPPRTAIRGVPAQVQGLVPPTPEDSPLLQPFAHLPPSIGEADRRRLTAEARAVFADRVAPALEKFRTYFADHYLPHCRETFGAAALPDGPERYAYLVRWQTTTRLTPQQIHEIGLTEVRRIRAEMEAIRDRVHFAGDFRAFLDFLRTDRQFYFSRPEELVDGYRVIGKRTDPVLPRLFGRLPRLPYGVLPVPDFRAESSPAAYYQSGAPETGRPGYFYANTSSIGVRPRWEMEALSFHEAVPGHHLQIALALELEDRPEFRKHSGYTAFVEGWGLYAESLGEELGFYTDPYSKIGQLTFDMWRSIRLVVDTGIHALGWSRDRAIDFFRQNTGKSDVDIAVEVDRYIVWPGQALAYKLGQLKYRELRTAAEQRLGDRFDVRRFHDRVLEEGSLPLDLLESRVRSWVDAEARRRRRRSPRSPRPPESS